MPVLSTTLAFVLGLSLARKVEHLYRLSPKEYKAIEFFVDECLIRHWPSQHREAADNRPRIVRRRPPPDR